MGKVSSLTKHRTHSIAFSTGLTASSHPSSSSSSQSSDVPSANRSDTCAKVPIEKPFRDGFISPRRWCFCYFPSPSVSWWKRKLCCPSQTPLQHKHITVWQKTLARMFELMHWMPVCKDIWQLHNDILQINFVYCT